METKLTEFRYTHIVNARKHSCSLCGHAAGYAVGGIRLGTGGVLVSWQHSRCAMHLSREDANIITTAPKPGKAYRQWQADVQQKLMGKA